MTNELTSKDLAEFVHIATITEPDKAKEQDFINHELQSLRAEKARLQRVISESAEGGKKIYNHEGVFVLVNGKDVQIIQEDVL